MTRHSTFIVANTELDKDLLIDAVSEVLDEEALHHIFCRVNKIYEQKRTVSQMLKRERDYDLLLYRSTTTSGFEL